MAMKPGRFWFSRAQAVGDPGAHARADQPRLAAVHQHQRRLVVGHVGVHRADDADVVDACSAMCGKISLTSMPLWPYFLNLNGDVKHAPVLRSVGRLAVRQRLAVVLRQHRLGIEGIDVRRAAVHEEEDDALGLAGKRRRFGRQRVEQRARPPPAGRAAPRSASSR